MEAAPAAQVAVKKNEAVHTQFRISLAELGLLVEVLYIEEEIRNECMIIRMFILVKMEKSEE